MAHDPTGLAGVVPSFHVAPGARVVAGAGAIDRVGEYAASYGMRVLLVAGESHARRSGLLARVKSALTSSGLQVELFEGVPSNPSVTIVDAGALLARTWRADVVCALGGGSVVDAAKAIAVAVEAPPGDSFRAHLSGIRSPAHLVDAALPVVAVPTLPGSGSETNGTSVIVDDTTGRKLSAHTDLAVPRIAILDPAVVLDAPPELLGPGLVDAWCHALEAGLSTHASIPSDALAEQAMRLLGRHARATARSSRRSTGRAAALLAGWWATNLAGQALALAGSIVTHPLAHPLSARLDARHGSAVAALEPAVLAVLGERFAEAGSLAKVARWLDVRGAGEPERALEGVLTKFARLCQVLGVEATAGELGLAEAGVRLVVRDARASGSRGMAGVPGGEPSADELLAIVDLALEHGPQGSPLRLVQSARAALRARDGQA